MAGSEVIVRRGWMGRGALIPVLAVFVACQGGTGTEPDPGSEPVVPEVDNDGDGVSVHDDCDDADPDVWSLEPHEGDVWTPGQVEAYCEGYCRRKLEGNLLLSTGHVPEGSLDCLRRITGDLAIQGEVTGIDGLASIRAVEGDLRVSHLRQLRNLSGLELESVDGDVLIRDNISLRRASAFRHLPEIGGSLIIEGNPNVEALVGRALTRVGGDVVVVDNLNLGDITALQTLEEVGGELRIVDNPQLWLAGLDDLTAVGGPLTIGVNVASRAFPELDQIAGLTVLGPGPREILGFDDLRTIDGDLVFDGGTHADLRVLGLSNLRTVGGDLVIQEITVAEPHTFAGISQLRTVGGSVRIGSDGVLQLEMLRRLRSLGGDLALIGNQRLIAVQGINELEEIGGSLLIRANDNLGSVSGLQQLRTVDGDVRITSNPDLHSLRGLSRLSVVRRTLEVASNWNGLETLEGLHNVGFVGGDVSLSYNYLLDDITALYSLTMVLGNICVYANPALTDLAVLEWVERIDDFGGQVDLLGTPGLCDAA